MKFRYNKENKYITDIYENYLSKIQKNCFDLRNVGKMNNKKIAKTLGLSSSYICREFTNIHLICRTYFKSKGLNYEDFIIF